MGRQRESVSLVSSLYYYLAMNWPNLNNNQNYSIISSINLLIDSWDPADDTINGMCSVVLFFVSFSKPGTIDLHDKLLFVLNCLIAIYHKLLLLFLEAWLFPAPPTTENCCANIWMMLVTKKNCIKLCLKLSLFKAKCKGMKWK